MNRPMCSYSRSGKTASRRLDLMSQHGTSEPRFRASDVHVDWGTAESEFDQLRLCRVTRANSDGLAEMAREFRCAGESPFGLALDDPDAFFDRVARFELGIGLPPDRVRMSQFWLFRGDLILGSSRLRHRLIPVLELDGGHIGYEIRPSERRKGLGSTLLRLTLQKAREIGLSRVLLTAEPTNLGSIGVIQANGGAFADTSISHRTGREMNRYWIKL